MQRHRTFKAGFGGHRKEKKMRSEQLWRNPAALPQTSLPSPGREHPHNNPRHSDVRSKMGNNKSQLQSPA